MLCMSAIQRQARSRRLLMVTQRVASKATGIVLKHAKSYAARHRCADKKDRTKAGYWACRAHKDFGKNVPGRFW